MGSQWRPARLRTGLCFEKQLQQWMGETAEEGLAKEPGLGQVPSLVHTEDTLSPSKTCLSLVLKGAEEADG